jgi:carboxypeptidase C (cathepsin A)
LWHFAQTWFEEFPYYKPHDEQLALFTESYGGHYGPAIVSHFMKQNALIANRTISNPGAHYLHMNTLGIVNGCIDEQAQIRAYADFAYNNTYGIHAFTEEQYRFAISELDREGGVMDQLRQCRKLQREMDPDDNGDVDRVSSYCLQALSHGANVTQEVYLTKSGRGWFDVTHPDTDSFPPPYSFGFLNQHWVQKALGVPVNHSFVSQAVAADFQATADMARGGLLEDIAYILDHNVQVTMMYGDRDYACNWIGGEASSLKIPWSHQDKFEEAGYTPLVMSPVHSGGLTRQYGNLSFTRVYQAGHEVPAYQPEASYEIFMRALNGRDIATGRIDLRKAGTDGQQYSTKGPRDTWWKMNDVLPAPPGECYIFDMGRCTKEEIGLVFDGTAIVKDWVVIGREEPETSVYVADELQQPLMRT